MRSADLTLAVLAGGGGTRLGGVAKGLLRLGEETVLARLLQLRALADAVVLVADQPAPYAAFGLPTVPDVIPRKGAPGGVVTALLAARTPWVLVVACDMPFVTRAAAEALLAAVEEGGDGAIYERDGRLEPLCAVYRAGLGPGWRAQLEEGSPSLQALVRSARLARLAPADAHALDSLNTPDDLARHGARR